MRLEIENLTKSYGKKTALKRVNLTLTAGVYALLGPNGARWQPWILPICCADHWKEKCLRKR